MNLIKQIIFLVMEVFVVIYVMEKIDERFNKIEGRLETNRKFLEENHCHMAVGMKKTGHTDYWKGDSKYLIID